MDFSVSYKKEKEVIETTVFNLFKFLLSVNYNFFFAFWQCSYKIECWFTRLTQSLDALVQVFEQIVYSKEFIHNMPTNVRWLWHYWLWRLRISSFTQRQNNYEISHLKACLVRRASRCNTKACLANKRISWISRIRMRINIWNREKVN